MSVSKQSALCVGDCFIDDVCNDFLKSVKVEDDDDYEGEAVVSNFGPAFVFGKRPDDWVPPKKTVVKSVVPGIKPWKLRGVRNDDKPTRRTISRKVFNFIVKHAEIFEEPDWYFEEVAVDFSSREVEAIGVRVEKSSPQTVTHKVLVDSECTKGRTKARSLVNPEVARSEEEISLPLTLPLDICLMAVGRSPITPGRKFRFQRGRTLQEARIIILDWYLHRLSENYASTISGHEVHELEHSSDDGSPACQKSDASDAASEQEALD
jgi:hypothetical protein